MKTRLTRRQWERSHEPWLEIFKDTLIPERASGSRNPIVFTDLEDLNELFRSLQIHVPEWETDPLWSMYLMPHKQKIGVDDKDSTGVLFAYFKCIPYADVLGTEFAFVSHQKGATTILQKVAPKSPRSKDPILCMWRVWEQKGPSSLSRYPFRILPKDCVQPGWHLFRPRYTTLMVERFHSNQTHEITGCRIRGKLYDEKTHRPFEGGLSTGTRVCDYEQEAGHWTRRVCLVSYNSTIHKVVCRRSGKPWHPCKCENPEENTDGWQDTDDTSQFDYWPAFDESGLDPREEIAKHQGTQGQGKADD